MPKELPQLPAFVTQPLECPLDRCHYPGWSLPPISTELASILPKWFLGRILNRLDWFTGYLVRSTGSESLTQTILFTLKNETPQFLREHRNELLEHAGFGKGHRSRFPDVVQLQLAEIVGDVFVAFETKQGLGCVHEFVDPSRIGIWRQLVSIPDRRLDLNLEEMDHSVLIGKITQAISRGTLDATGWGTKAEWQRDVAMLHETYVRVTTEQMVRDCRKEFETLGYRAVLERPGAILGLVSHLMLARSPSQTHLQSHVFLTAVFENPSSR